MKVCVECAGHIPPPRSAGRPAMYCSVPCRQKAQRRRTSAVRVVTVEDKICPTCGTPFQVKRGLGAGTFDGRRKYCSGKCRSKNYSANNPEKAAIHSRRWLYGMEPDDFTNLLREQEGRCPICAESMARPYVDHSHVTGKVRGLLCQNCNTALGVLKDDPIRAVRAAAYLRSRGA